MGKEDFNHKWMPLKIQKKGYSQKKMIIKTYTRRTKSASASQTKNKNYFPYKKP